jgi:hypothetical protein
MLLCIKESMPAGAGAALLVFLSASPAAAEPQVFVDGRSFCPTDQTGYPVCSEELHQAALRRFVQV